MKIVSFNVNGIRARYHQLEALIEKHSPEIIGLQEIKVHDSEFPHADLEHLGYHITHHGQKGHYGVAILSKREPLLVAKGFPGEDPDHQRRLLIANFELENGSKLQVLNGYFPQGENRTHPEKFPNKIAFYQNLQDWLEQNASPDEQLVVIGDMNIAPEDSDIGIGADNAKRWLRTGKTCFLPEEREWMDRLKNWGLYDTFRCQNLETDDLFSWFDYRSKGFQAEPKRGLRIDLVMATKTLLDCCTDTGIDYEIRGMEKPSDHCPIWAEFKL